MQRTEGVSMELSIPGFNISAELVFIFSEIHIFLIFVLFDHTKNITMIVDNLANAANYFSLHPLFEKAFEYIRQLNMKLAPSGSFEIEGRQLRASIVETTLKAADDARLETHKKFIDIQIPITKAEIFGWKSLSTLTASDAGYDEANDIEFYADKPSAMVTVQPGEFVIFSPEDGHAPLIGEGPTKKIIIKVAVL
jgi:YhcH/YjgK/YiaL family protein